MARKKSGCGIWMLLWIIIFLVFLIILLQNPEQIKDKKMQARLYKLKNYISKTIDKKDTSQNTDITENNLKHQIKGNHSSIELYFVQYIESQDKLKLIPVKRRLSAHSNTPLQDSIDLLLKGPSESESKKGLSSVFIYNTKLLDAEVKNSIAYLNFNSEIESGVGISTLQARLYQIVYTATQFPNVKGVIILINNKRKSTFSVEGLSLRNPLTRLNSTPVF